MSEDVKLQKWTAAADLGPIMRKKVEKVLSNLDWEGKSFYTASRGFFGDPVDPDDLRSYTTSIIIGPRRGEDHPDKVAHADRCVEADREIRERFDYTLTKANYKAVMAAIAEAVAKCAESRPVIDERRTRDEDADLQVVLEERRVKDEKVREERDAIAAEVRSRAPSWAEYVIVAELKEDRSDVMSDYFANHTVRCVAIGFLGKGREDFSKLHAAARDHFSETAGLTFETRRDNYSMGKGNYISDHGWDGAGSGWVVRRRELKGRFGPDVTEIAPELKARYGA